MCSLLPVKYCNADAITFMRQGAQIHLQSLQAKLNAGFVRPLAQDAVRLGMRDEALQRVGCSRPGDQQVEIADGLFAAPQTSRRLDRVRARGDSDKYVISSSAAFFPKLSRNRPARCRYCAIDFSTFSSSFAPMRGNSRSFCSLHKRSRSSMVAAL